MTKQNQPSLNKYKPTTSDKLLVYLIGGLTFIASVLLTVNAIGLFYK